MWTNKLSRHSKLDQEKGSLLKVGTCTTKLFVIHNSQFSLNILISLISVQSRKLSKLLMLTNLDPISLCFVLWSKFDTRTHISSWFFSDPRQLGTTDRLGEVHQPDRCITGYNCVQRISASALGLESSSQRWAKDNWRGGQVL